ncbi:MAG: hypothetical protein ACYDDF_12695 [Thermoplasmatota archaeon]
MHRGLFAAGVLLAGAGIATLAVTLGGSDPSLVMGAGGLLVTIVGMVLVGKSLRRAPVVPTIPMAHETFYQRVHQPVEQVLAAARTPQVARPSDVLEPIHEEDVEIHALDLKIHDLSRKISKATVMLGTGKLSQEGYRRYVDDLKSERADLEAKRVHLEMRVHHA